MLEITTYNYPLWEIPDYAFKIFNLSANTLFMGFPAEEFSFVKASASGNIIQPD